MKNITYPTLLLIATILLSSCEDKASEQVEESTISYEFDEPHRPQYHFSPPEQWMNDPNGMVYLDGEYHLFYQHYPDSNVWGPMHWGHAISTDMIHWEHLPIALYPDSLGYIFSGSAVIDHGNTSGLGTNGIDPMIAIYTYHHQEDPQSQGIAFSNDKGRSWTKYDKNPVLKSPGIPDFRDPKVSWYEDADGNGKWIMTLAVKDRISFYSSPNLIDWKHESDFQPDWAAYGGVWECPDLFTLKTTGGEEKWVLLVSINPGGPNGGSATQYFIGDFDGGQFSAEGEKVKWIDYGTDNYAGVTWSNIPENDGRRLFLGWMSNWQYANIVPTTEWRSAMTLPRSLELISIADEDYLASRPVAEISNLLSQNATSNENPILLENPLAEIKLKASDAGNKSIVLSNKEGESLLISMDMEQLKIDRSKAGKVDFSEVFSAIQHAPLEGLKVEEVTLYLDRSSIEIFINDGEMVMTTIFFPSSSFNSVEHTGFVQKAEIAYFQSIWK
ncbi:hypothetical protein GCM10007049_02640 [Echinicola pacifica]|uniref:Fructan beta-fructosidase n=1 Tax=Echinicola pacifica TaxID=346377 RepID=A0A918PKR5_9BACT|nr:glycoside hydrolase family 32 protein [Echinicola pacifica]GGZ14263.1 hypothetical protein GCM10007049_02640 [Echinicola pacifica]